MLDPQQSGRALTLQDTMDVWLRATRDQLQPETDFDQLESVREEALSMIGAATAQNENLDAKREAARFLHAVALFEGEDVPVPEGVDAPSVLGVERTTTESGPSPAGLLTRGLLKVAGIAGLGERELTPEGYFVPPKAAGYVVNRDLPRKAYLADLMAAPLVPGPNGERAVESFDPRTGRHILAEIPEVVPDEKGGLHSIKDYAAEVFKSRAGVREGSAYFLQTQGITGALVHRLGDGKAGWDKDVTDVFGNVWPYIPKVTGNRDLDRQRLMEDPAYVRALYETRPDFTTVMGVMAAGQAMGVVETVGLEALTRGAGRLIAKGGSLARRALPAGMVEGGGAMAELLGQRTAQTILSAARGLPEGGALRRYVVPGLGLGLDNWRQEITYGIAQSLAAGKPWTEGLSQGFQEGLYENLFGFAARGALKGAGLVQSRVLGEAWSRLAARPGAFQKPAAFMERLSFKTPPQYAQHLLDALPSRRVNVADEIRGFFRAKETGERMLQFYDLASLSYLHGGLQAAQARAAEEGRDWSQIPVLERAAMVLDPENLASPEVAGTALAFLAGGLVQYGLDRGGITSQPLKAEQEQRLKEILDTLPATLLGDEQRALRIVAGAIEVDDAMRAEIDDLRGLVDEFDPDRFQAENEGADVREHVNRLVTVQRDLAEAFRDEIAEAHPEQRDAKTAEVLGRYLDSDTIHSLGRLRQVEQEARARILNDPDPAPVRFAGEQVAGAGAAQAGPLEPPPANDPRPALQRGAAAFHWGRNPEVYDRVAEEDYTRLKVMRFEANREQNELLEGAILATGGDPSKIKRLSRDLTREQNRGLRGEGREIGRFPTEQSLRADVRRVTTKYASRVRPVLESLQRADQTRVFHVERLEDPRTLTPFVMAWAGVGYQRGQAGDTRPPTVIDKMARKIAGAVRHEGKLTRSNADLDGRSPMDVAMEVFSRLQGENPAGLVRSRRAEDLIRTVEERTKGAGLGPMTRGAAQAVRRASARAQRAEAILREQVEVAANLHPSDDRLRALMGGLVRGDPATAALFADPEQHRLAQREARAAQLYGQEAALMLSRADPDWWRVGSLILRGLDLEGDPAGIPASLADELRQAGLLEERQVSGRPAVRVSPAAVDGWMQKLSLEALRHPEAVQGNVVDLVTGWAHAHWQPSALTMGWAHRQLAALGNRWDRFAERWLDPHAWAERALDKTELGPVGWIASRVLRGARKGEPSGLAPFKLGRRERGFGKVARERRDAAFRKLEEARAQTRMMEWLGEIAQVTETVDQVAQGNRRYHRLFGLLVSNGGHHVIRSEADLVRRYGAKYGAQVGRLYEPMRRYVAIANQMGVDAVRQGRLTPAQFRRWRDRYLMRLSIHKDPERAYDEYLATLNRGSGDLSGGWQMHRAALDEERRTIYDFGFVAPRQAVIEATGLRFARVLHANADPRYSLTPGEARAQGVPEHIFRTGYVQVADRYGDAHQRGIHAHLHQQLGKMLSGELPATPKMMKTVTRLLGASVDAEGKIVESPQNAAHVDTASFQSIVRLFNQTLGDAPGSSLRAAIMDGLMLWRAHKTALNPKHLFKNITTSPLTNELTGGLPFTDFVTSFTLGRGFYADAAKGMIDWSDWHKRGRDPAWILTLPADRRAMVLKLDDGVRALGGNNFVSAFLQEDSLHELVRAVTNTQVAPGAPLDEQMAFAAWLGPTQEDRRRAGVRELAKAAGADDPRLVAKAWGESLAHYQTVEMYFKLANALYLESSKALSWSDAVNAAAVGTADYNDANPTVSDYLSNYRAVEWEVFRKMRRHGAKPSPLDPSENASWLRPLLGRPFLTYGMLMAPSLAWGAVRRPQRALANVLIVSGLAAAASSAMRELGESDEDFDEALLDSPQLAGSDVRRYYEERFGKGATVGVAQDASGFWPRLDVGELIERVGSGRAFLGISLPRGGRQRVLDLSDYAPQAALAESAGRAGSTLGSIVKGEGVPADEFGQQRTILGVIPAAAFEAMDVAIRTARPQKGRSRSEQAAGLVAEAQRVAGAAGSPFSWFLSPQVQALLAAGPGSGRTIFETMRGIRLPAAEEQGAGERMAEGLLSSFLSARTVEPRGKRAPESWYDDMGAALWGDNFHAEDTGRTGRSRIEEIATDRTLEQIAKLVRDAYSIYRSDLTGYSGGLDNVLESFLFVQRDIDPETGKLRRSPTSELGKFIASQEPEYQEAALYAAQRFLSGHAFNPENRSAQVLAMLGRQKALAPPLAERAFRASVRTSQEPLLRLLRERVVDKKDAENASAWYQLFLTLDPPDHPNPRWSSFEDYREVAGKLFEWGAGEDPAFPDPAKVFGALGPALYDVAPTEALRMREEVPALLR